MIYFKNACAYTLTVFFMLTKYLMIVHTSVIYIEVFHLFSIDSSNLNRSNPHLKLAVIVS